MKKKLSCALAAVLLATTIAGCGGADKGAGGGAAPAGAQAKTENSGSGGESGDLAPYQIGMITQLTGANSYGGNEYRMGAEVALELIGGEINGRKVEMVFADGPSQEAVISEYERLHNDGLRFFVSGYGCIADRSIMPMSDEMKAIYLSAAWDADLLQGTSDYFYRVGANITDFAKNVASLSSSIGEKYLNKKGSDLKVAIVYVTRLEHLNTVVLEEFAKEGIEVVMDEGYPGDIKDFVPIITKLKGQEYDIFIPIQGAADGIPFQQKMFEMGYRPPVTFGAGILYDTPVFGDLGSEITDGVLTTSYPTAYIAEDGAVGIKEFREAFEAKAGHKPLTHALQGYGLVQIATKILEQVPPEEWEDTAKLAEVTKNLEIPEGELAWYWGVKFEDNSNVLATQMVANQWVNSDCLPVYPENLKTLDAKVPWTE